MPVAPQLSQRGGENSGNLFVAIEDGQDGSSLVVVAHPPAQPAITLQTQNKQGTSKAQQKLVGTLQKTKMLHYTGITSALCLCGFGAYFATLGSLACCFRSCIRYHALVRRRINNKAIRKRCKTKLLQ